MGAAIGFMTSEPIPLAQRMGIRLARTALTVISLGRSRCTAPSMAASSMSASVSGRPDAIRLSSDSCRYTTMTTPVSTAMPNRAIYPTHGNAEVVAEQPLQDQPAGHGIERG